MNVKIPILCFYEPIEKIEVEGFELLKVGGVGWVCGEERT